MVPAALYHGLGSHNGLRVLWDSVSRPVGVDWR